MSLALNFYHDQLDDEGQTSSPLPAMHRLLYVRHGSVDVNGHVMSADDAIYSDGPVSLKSDGAWCEIWRWDLAPPNAAPALHQGSGVLTSVRMQRPISNFAMLNGTQWLFRLDRIITPAGRVADRHQHPGPGIRCLKEGTFNVQQAGKSYRDLAPGDPWWETGLRHGHRVVVPADGREIHARHGPADRMARQGDRSLALRRTSGPQAGQLEALCR